MSLDALKDLIPDYAKDLKINLSNIPGTSSLSPQQLWGTVLCSALSSGNVTVIRLCAEAAEAHLSPEAVTAAKSATAIMGMNNIYYRFTHLAGNEHYNTMPARLRMNVIGNPGVDKIDFELWSLAVSALEGCGRCIESHEKALVQHGTSREAIQDAVRIAAIIKGVAATLTAEAALSGSAHEKRRECRLASQSSNLCPYKVAAIMMWLTLTAEIRRDGQTACFETNLPFEQGSRHGLRGGHCP